MKAEIVKYLDISCFKRILTSLFQNNNPYSGGLQASQQLQEGCRRVKTV
ncbi:MAG: hypothetical protein HYX24_03890 [Candidatus Aenigmarchaeota archaeon]|nr:hypothetical protein [Candidatus Aenigmarchaeota archaeon]